MGLADPIRIGMLGCGTVGAAVLRLLDEHDADIARRTGCRLEVAGVAVRDLGRSRDVPLDRRRLTDDPTGVVGDPEVRIVVELMGGLEPAGTLIKEALASGKHVVTANKELLAGRGRELFEAAEAAEVELAFEAAVGGGIPLIRPLKESLAGERVTRLTGILNGTTNYILTRMHEERLGFDDALAEATRLGYAEADPTDDVEGLDAASKCAILASIAFNAEVRGEDVYREGISTVSPEDVEFAERLGYVVKPLVFAELEEGEIAARVHPAMIPGDHPLAAVRESFNALFVEGETAGELMFYGRGAGGGPTATAVVGDIVEVARHIVHGGRSLTSVGTEQRRVRPMDEMWSQYYVLLHVADRPGVLAQIAKVFGEHEVSIKSVWQEGTGEEALLVLITHRANEGALQRTVHGLGGLEVVDEVRSVMRVEGVE